MQTGLADLVSVTATSTLTPAVAHVKFARVPAAGDSSEALELLSTQGVEPLVSGRVLHEARLVAEAVVAVLAHAVEMCLVLAVVAAGEAAVLVEAESHVPGKIEGGTLENGAKADLH